MANDSRSRVSSAFRSLAPPWDAVNRRILRELMASPRLGMSELARRVGMSAPAVTERVQRLEEGGVIAGYRVELDPAAVGLPIAVYVRIRPAPGQLRRLAEIAVGSPEIAECHRVTGEDCFIARVHVASMEHLEEVLDRFLACGQTTSSIVQSSPVPPRPVPLPGEEPESG
jgi:Lrp/AsnC family leucine-responsive transcriptional regulator